MNSLFTGNEIPAGIPLSRYTTAISNAVAMAPGLSGVWVIAELSDVRSSGGHCYMELIEKNQAGQTIAKLRANIWRNNFIQLRQKFFSATNREISSGIKALVKGSATHHPMYGLSFNITDIDPSYTMGDMERIRREILLKLSQEGVLMMNKSIKFPDAPQRIAVISAEGAAGYGDFMHQLCGNAEGYVYYPHLFPCVMQGDRVSESVRNALQLIEASSDLWDCIVIIRGGGATTDLNGFDDYQLARAVATCGLPIVVGIGHERDRNVLDDIANTSLKTPTAVAGFFIDKMREAYQKVVNLADRLRVYASDMMRGEERKISMLQTMVPQLSLQRVQREKSNMMALAEKLPLLAKYKIGNETTRIEGIRNMLPNLFVSIFGKENIKIENKINLLKNFSLIRYSQAEQRLGNLEAMVKALDPKNTLKRGYSITRKNGKAIKSKEELAEGDILVTMFADGEIRSSAMIEEEK